MEGSALLLSIFAAAAAVSFLTIWRCPRYRTPLSFLLPIVFFFALSVAALKYGERFATCDAPDCGPSMFIAIGLFAMAVATSGFAGSIAGIIAGQLFVDRSKRWPMLAAIAIGFAVVGAHRIMFALLTGEPFERGVELDAAFDVLLAPLPFLGLAIIGAKGRLLWALGILATACLWGLVLCADTGLLRAAGWM